MKKLVTAEEFVRTWQASASVKEVATILRLSENGLYKRAQEYRKKGVKLKKFPAAVVKRLDVGALNKLIETLA